MCVCTYPATLDVVVFLLQTFLDACFLFVCDENETPPFLGFGVNGKFNGFDLLVEVPMLKLLAQKKKKIYLCIFT